MSSSNWPPPPIKPIFGEQAPPPEKKHVKGKENFEKAAEDKRAPKLSHPEPTYSPDGAIGNRGSTRLSVAEKSVDADKLPDTRSGKVAPRLVEFNRLGRHRDEAPAKGDGKSPENGPDKGSDNGPERGV